MKNAARSQKEIPQEARIEECRKIYKMLRADLQRGCLELSLDSVRTAIGAQTLWMSVEKSQQIWSEFHKLIGFKF